jgi:hypothetical protein
MDMSMKRIIGFAPALAAAVLALGATATEAEPHWYSENEFGEPEILKEG